MNLLKKVIEVSSKVWFITIRIQCQVIYPDFNYVCAERPTFLNCYKLTWEKKIILRGGGWSLGHKYLIILEEKKFQDDFLFPVSLMNYF